MFTIVKRHKPSLRSKIFINYKLILYVLHSIAFLRLHYTLDAHSFNEIIFYCNNSKLNSHQFDT